MSKILKMGMIGGGPGSMIGDIHRITATTSGKAELVCGAFSSSKEKSLQKGKELGLDESRIYGSYAEMVEKEAQLDEKDQMDFVAIVTPNHLHFDAAKLALEAGFHVICDKPLAFDYSEALQFQKVVAESKGHFAMTYTYRGYPLLEKAKEVIDSGHLGAIRKVKVDYSQGWLSQLIESEGHKQASWRTDPKKSGKGGTIADIGTHAFNLLESVSGLQVKSLMADVSILVESRKIDDDTNVLLEMENGAKGYLSASQICTGENQDLSLNIYGSKAGLVWNHNEPNLLTIKYPDFREESIKGLDHEIGETSEVNIPGHSPYFTEAFQRIYEGFFDTILNENSKKDFVKAGIEDGVRGMLFIEKAIQSSNERKWVEL
ncbi:oxidoreductase [Marivirga tractuosa]|uniref:Oxidoreductase domain protein n=1 Tax=Marivirga tractuosa (strain ATCC 23168 / DSM 4126 / NBRC 15989 / NCIMB 1408 / VKM B-1430 / H-43) TaxID=643867 RepID=E4TSZ9_MARTH|nr:Gfo/Idh/MocA family oxidoreductase [Marivirga tractuosa]ADR20847.1 oxidoreductase domain protein [Marivirga tractuosa DSM 4126]BDD14702.1 oxidoreductase [Marivirga tractuosa]